MRFFPKSAIVITSFAAICSSALASLQDATVLIDRALNSPTLTVRYSGASASLIELRVNGISLATRDLNARNRNGETNFTLDIASLEDGDNRVEILLYDLSGKIVGRQKTVVHADKTKSSPIQLDLPKSGDTVMGPVEIKIGLKREFRNPYISFFIDGEFKLLKNVPPYNYIWDTTRVANGWHEVQAWLVDDTNATFKTNKARVFVNNPGGRTTRQNPESVTIPASNTSKTTAGTGKPVVPATKPATKQSPTISENSLKPVVGESSGVKGSTSSSKAAGNLAPIEPKVIGERSVSVPSPSATIGESAGTKGMKLSSGVATGPKFIVPKGVTVASNTKPIKPSIASTTTTRLAPISIKKGTKLAAAGAITIAYDAKIIEFDVAPRVQEGIPLTPFRHLLEQSGGKVKWESDLKKVLASSGETQIELTIGQFEALINKLPLKMELAPFIDSGRTIVPLSFIRDALKVDVRFDPETGHVLISSPKK